jgi:predicted transcriptional regulator
MWYHSGTTQGVCVMSDKTEQVKTYVTPAEKRQLKEWAEETDQSLSSLVRQAVLEYTDRDRTARIEDKLDRVLASLDDDAHTHKGSMSGPSRSVPEKARAVADHLYQNYEGVIRGDDVELAIENIADVGDDRSVDKYKTQLKKRNLLFKHPNQDIWTPEKEQWVNWVEGAYVDVDVHSMTEPYNIDFSEYNALAEAVKA